MSVFLKRQEVRRRSQWRRRLRQVERVLLSVGLVLAGVAVLAGLYRLVFLGPSFTVRRIVVEGEWRHLRSEALGALSGVAEGDNLFMLSVGDVHERLRAHPWVRTTAVRRMLPDTLWIYVEEEEPAAIVADVGELVYVDAGGRRIKPVEAGEVRELPVFTGLAELEGVQRQERVAAMLTIASRFGTSSSGKRFELAEVNYEPIRGYSVMTAEEPMRIVLGHAAFGERIDRIERLLPAIASRPGRIKYMVANEQGRVVVGYDAA